MMARRFARPNRLASPSIGHASKMNAANGTLTCEQVELIFRLNIVDVTNYGRSVVLISDKSLIYVDMTKLAKRLIFKFDQSIIRGGRHPYSPLVATCVWPVWMSCKATLWGGCVRLIGWVVTWGRLYLVAHIFQMWSTCLVDFTRRPIFHCKKVYPFGWQVDTFRWQVDVP